MNNRNNVDRTNRSPNAVVGSQGSEALVRADGEFTNRLSDRRRGLLQRLWPDASEKTVAEYEARMLEQAAEAKIEGFRMYVEFQRQAVKEALDGYLQTGKVRLRKEQAEFFEYHARDLQQRVNGSTSEYFLEMERRLADLEESNIRPSLRARMERMLDQRVDEFENTITLLMARFASIPQEGV
jgi:hypothetical protein